MYAFSVPAVSFSASASSPSRVSFVIEEQTKATTSQVILIPQSQPAAVYIHPPIKPPAHCRPQTLERVKHEIN